MTGQSRGRPKGDHAAKRAQVAEAAWQVIERDGIAGATVRTIADEANCTTGSIAHYFEGKDDLLGFAMITSLQDANIVLSDAAEGRTGLDALRSMADAALSSEQGFQRRWTVWLSYIAHDNHEPGLAKQARDVAAQVIDNVAHIIGTGQLAGDIRDDIPAARLALRLSAVIDGLTIRARFDPAFLNDELAKTIVHDAINTLAPRSRQD